MFNRHVAWLFSPESAEGIGVARVLGAAGYDVLWVRPPIDPSVQPAVLFLVHDAQSWDELRRVLAWRGAAPAIYLGSSPGEAQLQLPGIEAVLGRPLASAVVRVVFDQLGTRGVMLGRKPSSPSDSSRMRLRDADARRLSA